MSIMFTIERVSCTYRPRIRAEFNRKGLTTTIPEREKYIHGFRKQFRRSGSTVFDAHILRVSKLKCLPEVPFSVTFPTYTPSGNIGELSLMSCENSIKPSACVNFCCLRLNLNDPFTVSYLQIDLHVAVADESLSTFVLRKNCEPPLSSPVRLISVEGLEHVNLARRAVDVKVALGRVVRVDSLPGEEVDNVLGSVLVSVRGSDLI